MIALALFASTFLAVFALDFQSHQRCNDIR